MCDCDPLRIQIPTPVSGGDTQPSQTVNELTVKTEGGKSCIDPTIVTVNTIVVDDVEVIANVSISLREYTDYNPPSHFDPTHSHTATLVTQSGEYVAENPQTISVGGNPKVLIFTQFKQDGVVVNPIPFDSDSDSVSIYTRFIRENDTGGLGCSVRKEYTPSDTM